MAPNPRNILASIAVLNSQVLLSSPCIGSHSQLSRRPHAAHCLASMFTTIAKVYVSSLQDCSGFYLSQMTLRVRPKSFTFILIVAFIINFPLPLPLLQAALVCISRVCGLWSIGALAGSLFTLFKKRNEKSCYRKEGIGSNGVSVLRFLFPPLYLSPMLLGRTR